MKALACLALALPQAQEHAALHPADAIFYAETPDVGAALQALEELPFSDLLRNEALSEVAGNFFPGFDLEDRTLGAFQRVFIGQQELIDNIATASFSLTAPQGIDRFLNPGGFDENAVGMRLVTDFRDPAVARAVAERFYALGTELRREEDGSATLVIAPLWDLPIRTRVEGTRFVAELGTATVGEEGLLVDSELARSGGELLPQRKGTVLVELVRRASVFDLVEAVMRLLDVNPGKFMSAIPRAADPFDRAEVSRMTVEEGRLVMDTFVPNDAVSFPLRERFLGDSAFADLPTDSMFAYVGSFEGEDMFATLQAKVPPTEVNRALQALKAHGIDVERLANSVGPGFSVHAAGPSGLALPPLFVWCDLRDVQEFQKGIDFLVQQLPDELPGLTAGTRDYKVKNEMGKRIPVPLTTFSLPRGEELGIIGTFLSPTIAVLPDRVLIGITSGSVKKELKRVLGRDGEMGGLVERVGARINDKTVSFSTMDWTVLIGGVWDVFRSLGTMMASMVGQELPFDPSGLPPSSTFTKGFQPSYSLLDRVEGGWLRRRWSSVGPETFLFPAAAYLESTGLRDSSPPKRGSRLPAGATNELATTVHRLDRVNKSLEAFRRENKKLPRELFDLFKPTPRYLGGFLALDDEEISENGEPLDGWNRPLSYERQEDGQTYQLWSFGPDGQDEHGGGDDVTSS